MFCVCLLVGHNVEIVRDGELLVGDDGSLLLSPVGESGDLDLNPDLGSGNGDKDLFERSISPLPQTLPPLPAHVEMVDFTWIAYNTTVSPCDLNAHVHSSLHGAFSTQCSYMYFIVGMYMYVRAIQTVHIHTKQTLSACFVHVHAFYVAFNPL